MSVLGPSIVGSIVQTSPQAQQVARQRDRAANQPVRDADRLHEILEAHLVALEEEDGFESPANLHVDQHLPDRHSKEEPPQKKRREPGKPGDAGDGEQAEANAPHAAKVNSPDLATLSSLAPSDPPAPDVAGPTTPPALAASLWSRLRPAKPEACAAPAPLYKHLDVQG
ncbi:MAG: hypothetical protein NTW19_02645 [Planctomycetota bacterium]|nr:hypothetical protein [Planctomycetota bacterium]